MAVDPKMKRRAVLQQEEETEGGEQQAEGERRQTLDSVNHSGRESREDLRYVGFDGRLRARGAGRAHADTFEP